MAQQPIAKNQKQLVTSKSFMTVGPTLHYSHSNVYACWVLAMGTFVLCCLFWTKITAGSFLFLGLRGSEAGELWRVGQFTLSPLSIFEYPWQILILGLLMGVLAVVPVLVSQLLSFSYSIPLILAVCFLANLPGLAICLLISCIATASRPLRFRSRFIAVALCMAPQLIYWAAFGGAGGVEPIKLGFSFAPWICAWLTGLAVAAEVLGIGHFTRYRPGLVWIFTLLTVGLAYGIFTRNVGFAELAYQRYIAKNNPEEVPEFHDHSITKALDQTITDPHVRRYLAQFFYPTEPILLREELKKEIMIQLGYGRWPSWFILPDELDFRTKKDWLIGQYDLFINGGFKGHRMPIALYYKALLSEYTVDIGLVAQKEILHFYSDYPHQDSLPIWYQLYEQFGSSSESLEARLRIAIRLAGQGKFERTEQLIAEAQNILTARRRLVDESVADTDSLLTAFSRPAVTAMTAYKLTELARKLEQIRDLISSKNRTDEPSSRARLAKFVILNPHSRDYSEQLERLQAQMKPNEPLQDNILLAKIMLIEDQQLRVKKLKELWEEHRETDGGIRALYELGVLQVWLSKQQTQGRNEEKRQYLTEAITTLKTFVRLYPDSIFTQQAQSTLNNLPSVE
jgi:hypothetical protein